MKVIYMTESIFWYIYILKMHKDFSLQKLSMIFFYFLHFINIFINSRQNREVLPIPDIYELFSLSFSFASHINATVYLCYVKINMSAQNA